jgi:alpha-L-fucosidase 2
MNIFPLCELDYLDNDDLRLIENTLARIEKYGTISWIGFSFVWMAALYALAANGEEALNQLNIFADAFVSVNGFHLNGDQKKCGYSRFTYRPFTLEGNGMLAEAVDEMLMQYHHKKLRLFPAVPESWKVGEGCAFCGFKINSTLSVSASLRDGKINCVIENLGEECTLDVVCFGKIYSVRLNCGTNELNFA